MTDQSTVTVERSPDVLKSNAPALSATSDMPVVTPAVEKTEATPDPVVDAPVEPTADKVEAKPDGKPEETKEDKTPPWLKAEVTKERNKRREAEESAKTASEQLATALKAIEQLSTQKATEQARAEQVADPQPKREAFDDPGAYDAALIAWSSRQGARVALAEAEQSRLEKEAAAKDLSDKEAADKLAKEQADQQAEIVKSWNTKRDRALEEFPDYAEVAESDDLQISIPMSHAIIGAENGPQLAYYLGKHPEEAARIAALNPVQQVFEMGKLAIKASAKPVSRVPDPIVPVGAKQGAVKKGPHEESMEEYATRRQSELREQRKH